jgi:hypothetical protein
VEIYTDFFSFDAQREELQGGKSNKKNIIAG